MWKFVVRALVAIAFATATAAIAIETPITGSVAISSADLNNLPAVHGDSDWTLPTGNFVFMLNAPTTATRNWTWPAASAYKQGAHLFFLDQQNYLTVANQINFIETGSDTFNGAKDNIPVGVPGTMVEGTTDGTSNWTFKVVTTPSTNRKLTDFGATPISIDGEQDCYWGTSNGVITCPGHSWTNREVALITADVAASAHKWKVVLQYAGPSNATLISYISVAPTAGSTSFTIAATPSYASAASPNNIQVISTVNVQAAGSGYNIGSCWSLAGGTADTAAQICNKVLTPVSATINTAGSGGTPGTYACSLGQIGGDYALGGQQETGSCVVNGSGNLTSFTPTANSGLYTSMGSVTYDGSGYFDAIPIACAACTGLTGSPSVNVSMGEYFVTDHFGRVATDGVYTGNIASGTGKWCGGGTFASTGASPVSGTDHGSGATFSCQPQPALVYAGYDNQSVVQNVSAYLNGITNPILRPVIEQSGHFLITGYLPGNLGGGVCVNTCINGKVVWKGDASYASGFFIMPGTQGCAVNVLNSNENGSNLTTGEMVTDPSSADQSGTQFKGLSFYGDQTSTVKPQAGVCFFGKTQRLWMDDDSVSGLPGGLWRVGGNNGGTGSIVESVFTKLRAGRSGDDTTLSPAFPFDAVSTQGTNNEITFGVRAYGNYYNVFRVGVCNNGGNAAATSFFYAIHIEMSGMDNYATPASPIVLNSHDCSNSTLHWPSTTGTDIIGGAGTQESGAVGQKFYGLDVTNIPAGTWGFLVQGNGPNDNFGDGVYGGTFGGNGGGVRYEACLSYCEVNVERNLAVDYALSAVSTPNANQVKPDAIVYAANGQGLSSSNVGSIVVDCTDSGLATWQSNVCALKANSVANSALAQMAQHTYKGNNTGSLANAVDVTVAQLLTDLNLSCSSLSGVSAFCNNTDAANLTGTVAAARLTPNVGANSFLGNNTALSGNAGFVQPKCSNLSDNVSACGIPHPTYQAGTWYVPYPVAAALGTGVNPGSGEAVCVAKDVLDTTTIQSLGVRTTTTSNTQNVQIAIYEVGSWGNPSTLDVATGSIAMGASAGSISGAAAAQITKGPHYFCVNQDNTTVIYASEAIGGNNNASAFNGANTEANVIGTTTTCGIKVAQTFGTWPTWTSGTSWSGASTVLCPQFAFQTNTVP